MSNNHSLFHQRSGEYISPQSLRFEKFEQDKNDNIKEFDFEPVHVKSNLTKKLFMSKFEPKMRSQRSV